MTRQSLEMLAIVLTPSSSSPTEMPTPTSCTAETPIGAERPPSPEKKAFHDSNTFLTALAAQERRVLELREDLHKAEGDLEKLKKQWAVHEAAKKRSELRQLEPLQPLSVHPTCVSSFRHSERATRDCEKERRKVKPITACQPQRTVFSGSRHTKTLSLLSPKSSMNPPTTISDSRLPAKVRRPPRSNTVPEPPTFDISSSSHTNSSKFRQPTQGLPRDDIVETGKQLVGDIRDGLWTFFEDLRQATVGEDINTSVVHTNRKQTGESKLEADSKRLYPRNCDSGPSHFLPCDSTFPVRPRPSSQVAISSRGFAPTPSMTEVKHQKVIVEPAAENDGWDNWDSPPRQPSSPQSSSKSHTSDAMISPVTDQSTPRTSVSSDEATPRPTKMKTNSNNHKEIPWPAITTLPPGNLKRTASSFMSEWERSLTLPNGEDKDGNKPS